VKRTYLVVATIGCLVVGCRDELRPSPVKTVVPPVSTPASIPDAPVSGTIRGAPFVARDARYVVDRRVGYLHTDIRLSSGKADSPCGAIEPPKATSVWLRVDGPGRIESKDVRLAPGEASEAKEWSVHYQVFDGEQWSGVGEGGALLSIREPNPDGRVLGGLAVCFADDSRSCVSGSFQATNCPQRIDEPVRGALPLEVMNEKR
jgi:hypothetical protein